MGQTRVEALRKDWKGVLKSSVVGGGAPLIGNQLLIGAGFTTKGVTAGSASSSIHSHRFNHHFEVSTAAAVHSTIGNAAAGGTFATLQSIGATGLLATGPVVVAGALAGGAIYGAWKLYKVPVGEDRVAWFLKVISEDQAKRDEFWSRISV